ncbi:hypothetical protein Gotri_012510 [Gossypium trilobum]|uniref:Uncharacterized protein n=1 Tax=Gossypium trilobum TaxID=34281 RepID=A0A7J9DQH9_9ROSI|nr:hypothetical protein [Gossypium trilobum]
METLGRVSLDYLWRHFLGSPRLLIVETPIIISVGTRDLIMEVIGLNVPVHDRDEFSHGDYVNGRDDVDSTLLPSEDLSSCCSIHCSCKREGKRPVNKWTDDEEEEEYRNKIEAWMSRNEVEEMDDACDGFQG